MIGQRPDRNQAETKTVAALPRRNGCLRIYGRWLLKDEASDKPVSKCLHSIAPELSYILECLPYDAQKTCTSCANAGWTAGTSRILKLIELLVI
jgi:hypothetical protein